MHAWRWGLRLPRLLHSLSQTLAPTPAPPQAEGRDTTGGVYDERMYRYGVSPEAQDSHDVERCYRVLPD